MAQLRQDYAKFQARNTEILVIGPEGGKEFKNYWETNRLLFIGLPDPEHHVLKLFGQQFKLLKMGRMPAQMLVDRQGIVRFVHYGESMSDIPITNHVLAMIDEINRELQSVDQPEEG